MHEYYKQQVDEFLSGRYCDTCRKWRESKEMYKDGQCLDCRAIEEGTIEQNSKHGDL